MRSTIRSLPVIASLGVAFALSGAQALAISVTPNEGPNKTHLEEAESLLTRLLELRRQKYGELHEDTLRTLDKLVDVFMKQEKWESAADKLRDLIEIRIKTLGESHPDSLEAREKLAEILVEHGASFGSTEVTEDSEDMESVVGDKNSSIWKYLRDKYDRDDNGELTEEEYGRGKDTFARIDRNGDGIVTRKDFESSSRGNRGRGRGRRDSEMRNMMSAAMIGHYFQVDENAEHITFDEVEDCFDLYDEDGDGVLSQDEFEAGAETREIEAPEMSRMMGDAYSVIATSLSDEDRPNIEIDRLYNFFQDMDLDDEGRLKVPDVSQMMRGGRGSRAGRNPNPDAPNGEGKIAPDFELQVHGGENKVRLSSFAGKRPVALIFGSYT